MLIADVSELSVGSILIGIWIPHPTAYEDGTDRVPKRRLSTLHRRRGLTQKTTNYTFHLGYKNQSVYAVSGTSRCLF